MRLFQTSKRPSFKLLYSSFLFFGINKCCSRPAIEKKALHYSQNFFFPLPVQLDYFMIYFYSKTGTWVASDRLDIDREIKWTDSHLGARERFKDRTFSKSPRSREHRVRYLKTNWK